MLAFHPPEEVHAQHVDGDEVQSFNIEITSSWLRSVAGAVPLNQAFDCLSGPLVALAVRLLEEFQRPTLPRL